ncbi:MAG: heat-inducible transcriptional repressor HrcA [Gammaproteobacteria bacterium]
MNNEIINERSQQVLKLLVECYISEGQPVGSRTLVDVGDLGLSSATVRNVMADLEAKGYLMAPHTSAGRIPTARGLRFFVDSLLTVQKIDGTVLDKMQHSLNCRDSQPNLDKKSLLANASEILSQLTHFAGLVTIPLQEKIVLRHVEFLPLSDRRILVILVINEREVRNVIIHPQREYKASELEQAANYINYTYSGLGLSMIRQQLLTAMRADRQELDAAIQAALDIADKALADSENQEKDYLLAGATNLIGYADGVDNLRGLFDAFAKKRDILHLLDQCLQNDGVQIFIGEEAGMNILGDFSMVTAPYEVGGSVVGVLGVIGPKHMPYNHVVPAVDVTAKLLGNALKNVN